MSYMNVPKSYSRDPAYWRGLDATAQAGTVNLLGLGDSLMADQGSAGKPYYDAFLLWGFDRYGNIPATPIIHPVTASQALATVFWSAASGTPGNTTLGASCQYPPPFVNYLGTVNVRQATTSAANHLFMLLHNGGATTNGFNDVNDRGGDYFPRTTPLQLRLWYMTGDSTNGDTQAYLTLRGHTADSPATQSNHSRITETIVDGNSGTFGLRTLAASLPQGSWNPTTHPYIQINPQAINTGKVVHIAGFQYLNPTSSAGMVMHELAGPGYTAAGWLANHGNCGTFLAGLDASMGGIDAIAIRLGTNDSGGATSKAAYKAAIEDLITFLRSAIPGVRILLLSPPLKTSFSSPFEDFPAALYEIAQDDELCAFINTPRLQTEDGQTAANTTIDGTHLSSDGAKEVVAVEMGAMLAMGSAARNPRQILIPGGC